MLANKPQPEQPKPAVEPAPAVDTEKYQSEVRFLVEQLQKEVQKSTSLQGKVDNSLKEIRYLVERLSEERALK